MSKITELISSGDFTYSLEITPDIPFDSLKSVNPLFFAVTWHAKSHQCRGLDIAPLKLATHLKAERKNVLLHLSCDMMREKYLADLLPFLQGKNIRNLFIFLGENYDHSSSDFKSSKELIRHIRQKTGQFFCIGVAGFPDCSDSRLLQLKEKIDEGSDFIITQAFFESNVFTSFVNRCRKIHVNVPVLSGIFVYDTKKELLRFTELCKVKISDATLQEISQYCNERCSGREILKKTLKEIREAQTINHFHFFTLNNVDRVLEFVENLGKDNGGRTS